MYTVCWILKWIINDRIEKDILNTAVQRQERTNKCGHIKFTINDNTKEASR